MDRRARYKNSGLDAKELRRRREEDSFQLRKQKRDDVLSKRRTINEQTTITASLSDEEDIPSNNYEGTIDQDIIDALIQDSDMQLLLESAQKTRKILSKESLPQFDEAIKSGLMPRFIELLDKHDQPLIQFEVAWILTNICSGTTEQTRPVVEHGAIPKLVGLMNSPDIRVVEQSVWALGNIIGDGALYRDEVIKYGFVPALLSLIKPEMELSFLRNETWVLVNICRNKEPPPKFEIIQQLIPALDYLIQLSDLAILIDAAWAVSYIAELGPLYSQLIIDSNLVAKMAPLLTHSEIKIQTAAIRALGSVVTGNEIQTQAVIDTGSLTYLLHIFADKHKDRIIKEALWFVSNITAGSPDQIQAVIDSNLIPDVVWHLANGDISQQKEALWTIYNISLSGTLKQLEYLVAQGAVSGLCGVLGIKDNGVVKNALEALNCILSVCYSENPEITTVIEECGGLDKIEELQSNTNCDIYDFAFSIIEKYFSNPETLD